jgi:hypothetical protein
MSWWHEVNADRREQEQLDALNILIEDAAQDTERWLQADLSTEERVHVLAIQEQLAVLARIIARRQDRVRSPKDNWEWSDVVTELCSQLERAWEVRANFVGKGLARLLRRLPQELPGWQPPPTSNAPSPPERLRLAKKIGGEQHNDGGAVRPTTNEKPGESSAAQSSVKSARVVESKSSGRKPERRDPEVAKRSALVRSNPDTPAEDICKILDREKITLPAKWLGAGLQTWTKAYKDRNYRSRIHTLLSKDRQKN